MAITRASQARDVGSIPIARYQSPEFPSGGAGLYLCKMGIDPKRAGANTWSAEAQDVPRARAGGLEGGSRTLPNFYTELWGAAVPLARQRSNAYLVARAPAAAGAPISHTPRNLIVF